MSKKLSKKEIEEIEITKDYLLKNIKQAKFNIYTKVDKVSSSGMSRLISCYIATDAGEIINISYPVSQITGYKLDKHQRSLRVGGCGMDMCFAVVYQLGRVLFPNGFIPKYHNKYDRNGTPNDVLDTDGGYSLNYRNL